LKFKKKDPTDESKNIAEIHPIKEVNIKVRSVFFKSNNFSNELKVMKKTIHYLF